MRGEWTAAAYAALYDRVVDGFAPYETLVDSVAKADAVDVARPDVPAPESFDAAVE